MNFIEYVKSVETYRKVKDMTDLMLFNAYDNFEEFKHDVHVIYDGRYDEALNENSGFYRLAIVGK